MCPGRALHCIGYWLNSWQLATVVHTVHWLQRPSLLPLSQVCKRCRLARCSDLFGLSGFLPDALRDLQAPTAVLEMQNNKDKYNAKGVVHLDLTVSEDLTSTALEVSLISGGTGNALVTESYTPVFKKNNYAFELDIPCSAPEGPGYTITGKPHCQHPVLGLLGIVFVVGRPPALSWRHSGS